MNSYSSLLFNSLLSSSLLKHYLLELSIKIKDKDALSLILIKSTRSSRGGEGERAADSTEPINLINQSNQSKELIKRMHATIRCSRIGLRPTLKRGSPPILCAPFVAMLMAS